MINSVPSMGVTFVAVWLDHIILTLSQILGIFHLISCNLWWQVLTVGELYPPDVYYSYMISVGDEYRWDPEGSWNSCNMECKGNERQNIWEVIGSVVVYLRPNMPDSDVYGQPLNPRIVCRQHSLTVLAIKLLWSLLLLHCVEPGLAFSVQILNGHAQMGPLNVISDYELFRTCLDTKFVDPGLESETNGSNHCNDWSSSRLKMLELSRTEPSRLEQPIFNPYQF